MDFFFLLDNKIVGTQQAFPQTIPQPGGLVLYSIWNVLAPSSCYLLFLVSFAPGILKNTTETENTGMREKPNQLAEVAT